jgi:hypothetical protein
MELHVATVPYGLDDDVEPYWAWLRLGPGLGIVEVEVRVCIVNIEYHAD